MKQNSVSRPLLLKLLISALAWIWVIGILAAYIYGFLDIIQVLKSWLLSTLT